MGFEQILYEVHDAVCTVTLNRPAFLEKRPACFPLRPSVDMPPFYPWRAAPPFHP